MYVYKHFIVQGQVQNKTFQLRRIKRLNDLLSLLKTFLTDVRL